MNRLFQRIQPRHGALAALLLAALAAVPACESPGDPAPGGPESDCPASLNSHPSGEAYAPPKDAADPVTASFHVTIDPKDPALAGDMREPQTSPLTFETKSGDLKIWGGVKRFVKHPERLYLEVYFVSEAKTGIRDAEVSVHDLSGSATFYDFNDTIWAEPKADRSLWLGGIAPEGVGRVAFGFDASADGAPISFQLDLEGTRTSRVAVSSSPITVTPDGKEVWAVQADSDLVAVIDTATDERVAQVKTGGRPTSVAVSPDGKLVLVTCSSCNNVTVIDRAAREVTQVFTESDGVGREPRNIVVSPDGARAYVSAYVGDSVTAFERVGDAFRVLKEIPVGRRPVGLSVTPDGNTLYASHFMPRGKIEDNAGWASIVATDKLAVTGDMEIRDDGNVQESECLRQIAGFDAWTAEDLSFEGAPTQFAGLFLEPGGNTGWVPGLRIGAFPVFEGDASKIGFEFQYLGANSPAALFPINTRDPRNAAIARTSSAMDVDDRDEAFLKCLHHMEEIECVIGFPVEGDPDSVLSAGAVVPSGSLPLSETGVSRFIGFSRGGRRALVLSYIADEIMVVDGATRHPTARKNAMLSGSNPIGLAVTPDGKKGYVAYENSMFASVLDLSAYAKEGELPAPGYVPYQMIPKAPGQGASTMTFKIVQRDVKGVPDVPAITEVGQVALADKDPMDATMRLGKVLFTSSNPDKYPQLSDIREAACAACHPDGGSDGTVWTTMEGERRTLGLWGGTAGRGWLHASATHHDITDFATIIVKERLGGKGLSEDEVHALSEYVARGIPEVQRPKVDASLSAKGEALFAERCSSCHAGPKYTSGAPDSGNAYGGGGESGPTLFDVGSGTNTAHASLQEPWANLFTGDAKTVLLGVRGDRDLGPSDPIQKILEFTARPERKRGELKAPALTNTWENVLFFHDGRASSLEEAVKDISARTGEALEGDDLAAMVEYLKTL